MQMGDIRGTFLSYFQSNGHEVVPSSPLIPRNDPTLLFVNAGMVPFKNVFIGAEKGVYARVASAQKCVRAGGKHNDLDNVGYTARHHTFFEMLGNFSFGDYFKEKAIYLAWNLLIKDFGVNAQQLLVTHYVDDLETRALWKKISGLPDEKIISISTNDNFWFMGNMGPCGPCTEIFYDHGAHVEGGPPGSANESGDRFVEIWNIVFMQYEQHADGARTHLPKPCVDTGMGLERMTAVMQGGFDNYDIQLMRILITASADYTSTAPEGPHSVSHRVIADHLRSMCFLIADGVLPSNEGRGYVLRRIMRRAMRYAHLTGYKDLLLPKLVPLLVTQMGNAYPELRSAEKLMIETLSEEEIRFQYTLEKGLAFLEDAQKDLREGDTLSGHVAFKLYDTYGFPLDLTHDALRRQKIQIDTDEFHVAMQAQRSAARAAWKGSGDTACNHIWFDAEAAHGATEFLGYSTDNAEGHVLSIVQNDSVVDMVSIGDTAYVVTNKTPFYAESGGQVGDTGTWIKTDMQLQVVDTKKVIGGLYVHKVIVILGALSVGDTVEMRVDKLRRQSIQANHSATHLLHAALRALFGVNVVQKGSLVTEKRLRFDFSFNRKLSTEDLRALENKVNREILSNLSVSVRFMPYKEAMERGFTALFGEKYDKEVRVVQMGKATFSAELCGGTHVKATGDIGLFKIISENSVSSGIRRIEAITGQGLLTHFNQKCQTLEDVSDLLKTTPENIHDKISSILEQRKKLEKELSVLRQQNRKTFADVVRHDLPNGGVFEAQILKSVPVKDMRSMMDQQKKAIKSGVILLLAENAEKVSGNFRYHF